MPISSIINIVLLALRDFTRIEGPPLRRPVLQHTSRYVCWGEGPSQERHTQCRSHCFDCLSTLRHPRKGGTGLGIQRYPFVAHDKTARLSAHTISYAENFEGKQRRSLFLLYMSIRVPPAAVIYYKYIIQNEVSKMYHSQACSVMEAYLDHDSVLS